MSLVTKFFELLGIKQQDRLPFWLKITTKVPKCTYYFGPFSSASEAKSHQPGYLEDLIGEKAQGIHIELKQMPQPEQLTICDEPFF